jgi:Fe2+ transport system protein FeoA
VFPEGVRTLRELGAGEAARVVCVGSEREAPPSLLAAFGVVPGAEIQLVQLRPACVIRVDETELALDGEVADEILVAPLGIPTVDRAQGR